MPSQVTVHRHIHDDDATFNNTAGFMTHVTSRLTAKNRDQIRNPTLVNRVWATFTFLPPPDVTFRLQRSKSDYTEGEVTS